MDCAYLYGAGVDLNWDNLWRYRTIQAQTAHGYLQDYYVDLHGKAKFLKHPLPSIAQDFVIVSWAIAHFPLFIQKGLMEIRRLEQEGEIDNDTDLEVVHERMTKALSDQLRNAAQ